MIALPLPRNPDPISLALPIAAPFERAISLVGAERRPLPAHLIRDVDDPNLCPEELLPYLAWAMSVDVWRADWPAGAKRWVIANSLRLHRLKGTLAGAKAHVALAGSEVIRAITPPARFILGRPATAAEESKLLAAMPEARIYPLASAEPSGRAAFFAQGYRWGFRAAGQWFLRPDTAADRHQLRAELRIKRPDGSLAVIGLRLAELAPGALDADLLPFQRLYIPHAWAGSYMPGRGNVARQRWRGASGAAQFVVSFRSSPIAVGSGAVGRGMLPAQALPDTVYERHAGGLHKTYFGRVPRRTFKAASDAPAHVYDTLRLWDPKVAGLMRPAKSFWTASRRGIAPHTAILSLRVPVPGVKGKRHFGRPLRGNIAPHDGVPLAAALAAIRVSQAAHSRILADTETFFETRFYPES